MNKHRNSPKSFSKIKIGDKAEFDIIIDEKMHESFADLFADLSPIHCDPEFCKKTKFGKRLGYGFMLTGLLSRLYGEYLPGGSSICIKQDANFIKPFFIGDKIKVVAEVANKVESTKFIEIKTNMYRDGQECIFRGTGTVQVLFDKKPERALYQTENGKLYYSDFVNALKESGIEKGDTIFVHSDISIFGKLSTSDRNFLLQNLVNALEESVGEGGTVILPTFTYSFCNKEMYNVSDTSSTVGILTEFFRRQKNVKRTTHPIFSVAVWGKNKEKLMELGKDSFGENSIFGKLHKMKGKLLFLGADFQSCTFVHHIEKMHGIPYRFVKKFSGKINDGSKEYNDEYEYFVRYLGKNVINDFSKFEKYLLDNNLMKEVKLGNGKIMVVDSVILMDEGKKLLDKDIYFFLKEVPK